MFEYSCHKGEVTQVLASRTAESQFFSWGLRWVSRKDAAAIAA